MGLLVLLREYTSTDRSSGGLWVQGIFSDGGVYIGR